MERQGGSLADFSSINVVLLGVVAMRVWMLRLVLTDYKNYRLQNCNYKTSAVI